MRMSRRAASTNAIHVRIFVSIDRAALIITTIFRVIALAHSTRVNSAIHTVSTHFYAKHTILSNFINRIFMCGAWLRNVRERMLFGDPFFYVTEIWRHQLHTDYSRMISLYLFFFPAFFFFVYRSAKNATQNRVIWKIIIDYSALATHAPNNIHCSSSLMSHIVPVITIVTE